MKTEVIDHSQTRKELKIEFEPEEVRAQFDRACQEFAANATVQGFRKGRVPVSVVRTRFKNELRGEVVKNLVPPAIQQAIMEREFNVLGEPEIHMEEGEGLEKIGEAPFAVRAFFEVVPDIQLGNYKGFEVARRVRPVTDETVEQMINDLREQSASLQPVEDRGAQEGDTITVNFTGKYIEPASEEEIKADDVDVVLGSAGVLPEFTEQLTGVRPDDVKTIHIKYPEDFSSAGLAGKEIEYTATVVAVRQKELPELDDEWARSFGEEGIDSLAALRAKLREQLEERARGEAEHRLRGDVMGRLTAAHEFELPESLIQFHTRRLLESTARDMVARGVDPRSAEFNWEEMKDVYSQRAEQELRGSMLLERIADAEQIEPTEEEINEEIEAIATASRQTPEQVRAALTKQGGERSIADGLRHRRAIDILVANAKISDEEWREDEEPPRQAASAASAPQPDEAAATDANAVGDANTAGSTEATTAAPSQANEAAAGADAARGEGQG